MSLAKMTMKKWMHGFYRYGAPHGILWPLELCYNLLLIVPFFLFACFCLFVYLMLFLYQQFFAWFANVEAQMEEEQELSYRYYNLITCAQIEFIVRRKFINASWNYLNLIYFFRRSYAEQLSSYRDHCNSVLNEVESALNHLQDLHHKHLLVSTKTGALHEACEQLLQDQVRLIVLMVLDVGFPIIVYFFNWLREFGVMEHFFNSWE